MPRYLKATLFFTVIAIAVSVMAIVIDDALLPTTKDTGDVVIVTSLILWLWVCGMCTARLVARLIDPNFP